MMSWGVSWWLPGHSFSLLLVGSTAFLVDVHHALLLLLFSAVSSKRPQTRGPVRFLPAHSHHRHPDERRVGKDRKRLEQNHKAELDKKVNNVPFQTERLKSA